MIETKDIVIGPKKLLTPNKPADILNQLSNIVANPEDMAKILAMLMPPTLILT